MVKLTESMVLQRSRRNDLKCVEELNCWGRDITDVSILRRMPNIQTLSLSVNRISTLRDFQCCLELKDLYLRKNCIRDLSELEYLQELPNLQVLWLSENPCAYLPNYRNTVLRYLPKLLKLDNIDVSLEELREATGEVNLERLRPSPSRDDSSESDDSSSQCTCLLHSDSELSLPQPPPWQPKVHERSPPANVVQAVLILINELDRDALEIVDDAVRNRLNVPS